MQLLDDNNFLLFDGYYESSLIRSADGGATWTCWFTSQIAHYFQLHRCTNGNTYVIGLPGDGFASYSFIIPDSIKNANRIDFISGCQNLEPHCILVYDQVVIDRKSDYITEHIDTLTALCGNTTGIMDVWRKQPFWVYPNPAMYFITVHAPADMNYALYYTNGQMALEGKTTASEHTIYLEGLPSGIYFLNIGAEFQKLVKLE